MIYAIFLFLHCSGCRSQTQADQSIQSGSDIQAAETIEANHNVLFNPAPNAIANTDKITTVPTGKPDRTAPISTAYIAGSIYGSRAMSVTQPEYGRHSFPGLYSSGHIAVPEQSARSITCQSSATTGAATSSVTVRDAPPESSSNTAAAVSATPAPSASTAAAPSAEELIPMILNMVQEHLRQQGLTAPSQPAPPQTAAASDLAEVQDGAANDKANGEQAERTDPQAQQRAEPYSSSKPVLPEQIKQAASAHTEHYDLLGSTSTVVDAPPVATLASQAESREEMRQPRCVGQGQGSSHTSQGGSVGGTNDGVADCKEPSSSPTECAM